MDLQVKKTIIELQNLEKVLQCEDIDLRLVKEYRDAVDYIRTAAGTLQQLRECRFRRLDDGELLSVLASDRIRRTTNALPVRCTADLDDVSLNKSKAASTKTHRAPEHPSRPSKASWKGSRRVSCTEALQGPNTRFEIDEEETCRVQPPQTDLSGSSSAPESQVSRRPTGCSSLQFI